jgi:plastocyanin
MHTNFKSGLLALTCILILLTACQQPNSTPQTSPAPAADFYKVDATTAGSIFGRIFFSGKKPSAKKINMDEDPVCSRLQAQTVSDESVLVNQEGALANAFVYIHQGLEGKNFAPPAETVTIDQRGCWFTPRVLGIQAGQTLRVTNSDPLTHNIHPMPELNRDWNQSQPPQSEPLLRKFTQPEVMIRVKCNIHSWMHSWVGVVAHPYFAVTGRDGMFEFRNVPPGTYTIEVWQEALGRQQQQITLAASGKSELTFKFKGE